MSLPALWFSVDPGLAAVGGSGWAKWENTRLAATGVLRNPKSSTVYERIQHQRAALDELAGDAPRVCEFMVKRYGAAAGKMDVQDILDLNVLAGALGTHWAKPSEWKGGVDRAAEQSRSWFALDEVERAVVTAAFASLPKGVHKEILSAVGIGLSVAERAHRKFGWPA